MKWYIPDCFWPVKDQGDYLGHEAISVLNTAEKPITAHMTLYFEDREKLDGFVLEIPAERTIHFHTNELKNQDGQAIPRGVGYAAVIECSEPVVVQYTRVDVTQPALAIATTMAVPIRETAVSQMNQSSYIARKRKEQNLTQEQLERQKGILYGVPSSPSIFPAAPCRRQPGIPMCAILSQAS